MAAAPGLPGGRNGAVAARMPDLRPDERQLAVVLVAVEVRLGQGRRGRQLLPLELDAVVVPAQGERPLRPRLRPAAGRLEPGPGDAALDGPAAVAVVVAVEGAVQLDGGLEPDLRQRREAPVAARP